MTFWEYWIASFKVIAFNQRKQFFTPRAWNPGNVLLTSRNSQNYFYQCKLCPSAGQNMVSAASSTRKLLVLFWNPRIFSFVIFQIDQINKWLINYWTLDLFWHPNVWPSNFGWSVAKISHLFDKLILKLTRNFEWLGSALSFQLSLISSSNDVLESC